MTTDRKFCRFNSETSTAAFGMAEIPPEGLCLSAFVLLSPRGAPSRVLLGRMNPSAAWDHLGALDPGRVDVHSRGWMIPSSHLIYRESPQAAARRILEEQLGLPAGPLDGPLVVSEVYTPRRFPGSAGHWDLEFLFRGALTSDRPPTHPAWSRLEFVDVPSTPRTEFARSHEDVLASAGLVARPAPGMSGPHPGDRVTPDGS